MNIAAITKYKHGNIYKLLQKLGWSQSELARRCGMNQTGIGEVINMNRRPSEKLANAIQRAFGEAGEYLDVLEEWPDAFRLERGFKREEMADVPVGNLLYSKELLALEFESTAAPQEMVEGIESAMNDLPPKEKIAIECILDQLPQTEISKKLKVGRQRASQLQAKALRSMRHPARIARLNCDIADESIECGRKQAAKSQEEQKARDMRYLKEELERRAKQEKLNVAREKHPEVFSPMKYFTYSPSNDFESHITGVHWNRMASGRADLLKFIRTYIDPEWPADREFCFDVRP